MIVTDWLPQDKFLQLIPLDRSLKQTQEQDIYTQTRNFPIKNTTWNTRQVKMREQPIGIHRHAL